MLPPGVRKYVDGFPRPEYVITTVYGKEIIDPGDWIVITDDGNWRKCKKAAFEEGFEPVEEPARGKSDLAKAMEIVRSWPAWKRSLLVNSSKAANSSPRPVQGADRAVRLYHENQMWPNGI